MIASNPALAEFGNQIKLDQTPEGLQIQLVDAQNRPMFDVGSAIVKPYMRDILREIGGALTDVENRISLAGHTDAMPYGSGDRGYSNWELSADRANASRRELVVGGLPDSKMLRVEGLASSRPMTPEDPGAPTNRRISILILTKEAERRVLSGGAPEPGLDGAEMPAGGGEGGEGGGADPADSEPAEGKIALPRLQIAPEVTKH
jgi:chemotaxis protein MotB